MNTKAAQKLTRRDFQTDQDVRWCPGCGDYAILATIQKVFPELGIPREDFAVVSGIGCSSRFPYYMNTYGFHTIHGRAFSVATGLKATRPELSVWVVTGDGDALSIGGNHFIHTLRRNVDLKILLFNNQVYGLTKGQYSPTSEVGKLTKSTPMGSLDNPVDPVALAIGAGATFVARTIDREPAHMASVFARAAAHRGTALVEIYQNCNIFNDGAFETLTDRKGKSTARVEAVHGQPLVFGSDKELGVVHNGFGFEVARIDEVGRDALVVHDEAAPKAYAFLLSQLAASGGPTPIGVLRAVDAPTYDAELNAQVSRAVTKGPNDLQALLRGRDTWEVRGDA
jgi:2-oxoglutarate ferredoxin oxidoreductase subunit beta